MLQTMPSGATVSEFRNGVEALEMGLESELLRRQAGGRPLTVAPPCFGRFERRHSQRSQRCSIR